MEGKPLVIYYDDKEKGTLVRCKVPKWQYHGKVMSVGEEYVTFDISAPKPIQFSVGDYCIYRGSKFYLNVLPEEEQNAAIEKSGEAFKYTSVRFDAESEKLGRIMMLDITPTTGDYVAAKGTNFTGSANFQLYCGETKTLIDGKEVVMTPVCVLANKIQANLDRAFPHDGWHIHVNLSSTKNLYGDTVLATHTDDKTLSFNCTTVANALAEVNNTFDLDYFIKDKDIYIGYPISALTSSNHDVREDNSDDIFYYFGYGKGYADSEHQGISLFKIKRNSESNQQIVTRLRALGSTRNMPYRYYNKKYDLSQSLFPQNLQLPDTFETPDVKEKNNAKRKSTYSFLRAVKGDTNDSYIDKNDDALSTVEGLREGVALWDGSNSDLEEIYPSIQEGKYRDLRAAEQPDSEGFTEASSIKTDDNGKHSFINYLDAERIDEVLAVGYLNGGSLIDDANLGDGIDEDPAAASRGTVDIPTGATEEYLQAKTEIPCSEIISKATSGSAVLFEKEIGKIETQYAGDYAFAPSSIADVVLGVKLLSDSSSSYIHCNYKILFYGKGLNDDAETPLFSYEGKGLTADGGADYTEVKIDNIPNEEKTTAITLKRTSDVRVVIQLTAGSYHFKSDKEGLSFYIGRSKDATDTETTFVTRFRWGPVAKSSEYLNDPFHLIIKDMGFDLAAQFNGQDTPQVEMKDGRCVGRKFKISNDVQKVTYKKGGKSYIGYLLKLSRDSDTSIHKYYPSETDPITAGDHYILTGIQMPDAYVRMAEIRLLAAATQYLADNCETKYTFEPSIDNIYLARNYDKCKAEGDVTKSLYWNLYAGVKFPFRGIPETGDFDETIPFLSLTIETITIKEENGFAPNVELTLNDDVEQSTYNKITTAVDRIYNGSLMNEFLENASLGGTSKSDILTMIQDEGRKRFISKLTADEAAGRITFDRGIVSKEDVTAGTVIADGAHSKVYGDNAGYRLWLTDGASNLELDNLTVRGKWVAHVLEVMRLQYSEGNRLLGCAGSTIQSVEAYSADDTKIENGDTSTPVSYYRCYFPATDGTDHISQPWHKGDYARCQTFNLTDGTYVDATNRIYMRLVTDVSSSPVKPDGTGNECHWVDLSNERNILLSDDTLSPHVDNKPCMGYLYLTDKESGRITDINDIPASGDHIAQVGNAIDTSRQGAIQLIVNGDNPAICVYGGINRPSQSLDEFLYHKISPAQTIINSQQIVLTTGMHQSYPYVDCGDWTEGTTAYQTEVYRYGGSTWVCLKNDTTSAPNSEDGCWAVFAEKGRDAASKRYILIPNIGSIRRNKFGIASAPKNTVTTKLVYYGGRLIAIDEQHTKMLADRQTPKADDADFRAKGYMFVDNIETKDTSAAVQIEQRDTLGNTLAVVTGADEASLQFADIDAKADSLEVTYLTDGQPCAARTVPIIYDGTDGEDGQDGEEYTVQPSQIIITERLDGTLLDDDAQLKSRLEYIYDLPQTFRIMHNHGGESESVEYDRFARGKGSALLGQTRPERVGDYYRISDGYGISTRELQANTDIRQMEYKMYVDGHVVILPIYINRIGTMVSRTVGDTTETLRKRTYTWADEEGTAHTGTLESFVSDASDIFSRTMKKVVEGQTEAQSNITQTADKISASVTSLKDGISKTGIDIDAHTITAQGEQFRWLNPDGTPLVEFKSNITENAGATFHGHMDATTISTSSGRFTVDEAGNMTAINGNLQSGQIGRIRIDYNGLLSDINGWRMRIGSNGTAYWGWKDESIGFGYTEITNRGKITTTESINALAGIQMNCQFITDTQKDDIVPGTVFVGITDLTQRFDIRIRTIYMNENGHYLSWPIGQQLQIVNTTNNRISVHSDGQAGTGYFYPSAPKPYADNERSFGQWLTIKEYDTAILMWDGHRWWKTAEYIG